MTLDMLLQAKDGYDKELNDVVYIANTKPPWWSQVEEKVDYTGDDAVRKNTVDRWIKWNVKVFKNPQWQKVGWQHVLKWQNM